LTRLSNENESMPGVWFRSPRKGFQAACLAGFLMLAPCRTYLQAASPQAAAAEPQKNWKDRPEYDLYDSIIKDATPKTRLEKLQQWEKQYPQTDWIKERRTLLMTTYFSLQQPKEAVEVAKQILADDAKNFSANYIVVTFTQALAGNNPAAEVLDQGATAARTILAGINAPPVNFTADQWKAQRPQVEELAHTTLGWVDLQKKDWLAAESEFQKTLQMDPNSGQVDYYMGTAIASEKDLKKMPQALFYFARAAGYEGQGALNPTGRQQVLAYVQKAYKGFHGSDEGFDKLMALAKSTPAPAADFTIKNANEIAQAQAQSEEEWNKTHPEEAMWKVIKAALTGPDGAGYFENNMKGTEVPTLKGKVVKLEPAVRPKMVELALEDGSNASGSDATLKFEGGLPGEVAAGTELTFEGVAESFTPNPLMVVFSVDKDKLHGWTGKNAPAAPRKKTAPKKQ